LGREEAERGRIGSLTCRRCQCTCPEYQTVLINIKSARTKIEALLMASGTTFMRSLSSNSSRVTPECGSLRVPPGSGDGCSDNFALENG